MKVLIVLALAFAVANAGFTGSLVQQTKPILDQAINGIKADLAAKVPARNSAEAGFQTQFVQAISNHVTSALENLGNVVDGVQQTASEVVSAFHLAVSQMQQMGASAYEGAQSILANLFNSITGQIGSLFGRQSGRSSALAALITQVATSQQFLTAVHNTGAYQCLVDQDLVLTFEVLRDLYRSGNLGEFLDTSVEIAHCVKELGGIETLVHESSLVQLGSNLAASFGLTQTVHALILQHGGSVYAPQVVAALQSRPKAARALSPAVLAIVAQVAKDPEFVRLVRASPTYKCLQENGVTVTLEHVLGLYTSGQLNFGLLESSAAVATCVEQAGSLTDIIAGSGVIDYVQATYIQPLGLAPMIHSILNEIAPELADAIIAAFGSKGRFLGGVWDAVQGAASNAWNGLTDSISGVAQNIFATATTAWESAVEKFEIIKLIAAAVVQGGITTAQDMTQQAAQALLNQMSVYASDLGTLYDQAVAQLTSIWDGLTLPSWESRRVKAF